MSDSIPLDAKTPLAVASRAGLLFQADQIREQMSVDVGKHAYLLIGCVASIIIDDRMQGQVVVLGVDFGKMCLACGVGVFSAKTSLRMFLNN